MPDTDNRAATPIATRSAPIALLCDECGEPVTGTRGQVWISGAALAAHERAGAEWDKRHPDNSGLPAAVSLTELLKRPDAVKWQIHHDWCNPNLNDAQYGIEAYRIDTERRLLDWTAHLMGKAWLEHTNWDQFIQRLIT
jgi:hypothetical protein